MPLAFFQETFDALPAHIAILDGEGAIIAVNASWMRFASDNGLNHPLDGVGLNYLRLCDEVEGVETDEARAVGEGMRAVLAGWRDEFCLEYPCHGLGVQRWFEVRVRRISHGGPGRLLVVHENITGKKLAELELRARERRLSLALDAGGLGAFERPVNGDLLNVSRLFCSIVGLPPKEVVSYYEWVDRVHPDDRWRVLSAEERMVEMRTPVDVEYRLWLPDGVRWVRAMAAPDVEGGKVLRIFGVLQDITARKAAEAELRRASRIVEQSPVSVVITNTEGDIEYVNAKFCSVTGYTAAEVKGKNPRILKSGELPNTVYREMWSTLRAGEVWHGEFHNRRKNGELFWERASISPIRDRLGAITHFAAVKEDVTEWKRSEAALHEAEERYRSMFERSLECMYVHDFEGRFIDLNEAALALLGYGREELSSLNFGSVLVPGDVPRAAQVVQEVIAAGSHPDMREFTVRTKSGALVQVECKSSLLTRNGLPFAVQGVARDITERKRADEALRTQLTLRERLAKIAENAPGMIYTFRLRPDGTGCMPYATSAIEDLFGIKAEEWAENSETFFELIDEDDRERMRASVLESANSMGRWHCEFRVRHPRRGTIWIEARATPEREADGGTIWHGFMCDITERKRTASELEQHKEKEERARRALEHEKELNQVKSRFVSLVSHEFRSPLCVINMAASMLDGYLEKMSSEERTRSIGQIQRAVARMTRMMEDLLEHERLGAGVLENAPTRVNLESLCRLVVPEITNRAGQVAIDVGPELGYVMLDEPLITHVLTNLLGNAVKYSAENAPVTLKVERVDEVGAGASIRFVVRDRGIGIPAEDLPSVFQAFRRGANVENRPGTGMGLPIVKQCVVLLGGSISIDSREGEGTTVCVHVPFVPAADDIGPGL